MKESELRQIIREELLNDGYSASMRNAYYELGDKIIDFMDSLKSKEFKKDARLRKYINNIKDMHGDIYRHLNKHHKGWD